MVTEQNLNVLSSNNIEITQKRFGDKKDKLWVGRLTFSSSRTENRKIIKANKPYIRAISVFQSLKNMSKNYVIIESEKFRWKMREGSRKKQSLLLVGSQRQLSKQNFKYLVEKSLNIDQGTELHKTSLHLFVWDHEGRLCRGHLWRLIENANTDKGHWVPSYQKV